MVRLPVFALAFALAGCPLDVSGLGRGEPDGSSTEDARADDDASAADAAGLDAAGLDAGDASIRADAGDPPPTDFFDLTWETPAQIPLDGPDPCGGNRWFDPIVTADGRWMFISERQVDCSVRRFQVYRWRNGDPRFEAVVGPIHPGNTEHNGHPIDGAILGRPGDVLLLHTTGGGAWGDRDLWSVWLSGEPPSMVAELAALGPLTTAVNDDGPTTTRDATRLIYSRDDELHEAVGSPPAGWTVPTPIAALNDEGGQLDPALTADGRVLVWARTGVAADVDLFVSRRRELDQPWSAAERLPKGPGQINSGDDDWDAFITVEGDLLYTRRDGSGQLVYRARAAFPRDR